MDNEKLKHLIENVNMRNQSAHKFLEQYKVLVELDLNTHNYIVILCVGGVLSLVGLVALITAWCIFPKTRNFQSYVTLNQCIMATILTCLQCVIIVFAYELSQDYHSAFDQALNDTDLIVTPVMSHNYNAIFLYFLLVFMYIEISFCCWTTAAAVMCYMHVVRVFTTELRRKYLIVNLVCYGTPAFALVMYGVLLNYYDMIRLVIIMLAPTAVLAIVNTCIYLTVMIAICKGKKPGKGETLRTVTTALLIFIIFGLGFSIGLVILLSFEPTRKHVHFDSKEFVKKSYSLFYIKFLLISAHAISLSIFSVFGRRETRKWWCKLFCNKKSIDISD